MSGELAVTAVVLAVLATLILGFLPGTWFDIVRQAALQGVQRGTRATHNQQLKGLSHMYFEERVRTILLWRKSLKYEI